LICGAAVYVDFKYWVDGAEVYLEKTVDTGHNLTKTEDNAAKDSHIPRQNSQTPHTQGRAGHPEGNNLARNSKLLARNWIYNKREFRAGGLAPGFSHFRQIPLREFRHAAGLAP
jgi:hypothetical protein